MRKKFVMWGAPSSGKTSYLLSLVFWQEHREGKESERRLCVLPGDRDTAAWIARMAALYGKGEPLPKTSSLQRLNFRLYDLPPEKKSGAVKRIADRILSRKTRPSHHKADLTFWDAPGEFFEGPIPDELLPELVTADGLILIVPQSADTSPVIEDWYWNFFNKALSSLKNAMIATEDRGTKVSGLNRDTSQIRYPVAVCLSKSDLVGDPGSATAYDRLAKLLGRDLSFLNGWLEVRRVFAFSATGPTPNDSTRDRVPRPLNIMYPVEWLLGHQAEATDVI